LTALISYDTKRLSQLKVGCFQVEYLFFSLFL
jgi:hypothetical protein